MRAACPDRTDAELQSDLAGHELDRFVYQFGSNPVSGVVAYNLAVSGIRCYFSFSEDSCESCELAMINQVYAGIAFAAD